MDKYSLKPEDFNAILSGIQLSSISLSSSKTEVKREFIDDKMSIAITTESTFKNEKAGFSSVVEIKLIATNSEKKHPIKINASYFIIFEAPADITTEFFEIYKDHGLIMTVWPFFREFVFDHTSKMNIKPLTLPLIKR